MNEFKVGKWYKRTDLDSTILENNECLLYIRCSNAIERLKYDYKVYSKTGRVTNEKNGCDANDFIEVPFEEVAQYITSKGSKVPKELLDNKRDTNLTGRYLRCLKDNAMGISGIKKGDYLLIVSDEGGKGNCTTSRNSIIWNWSIEHREIELMPIEFKLENNEVLDRDAILAEAKRKYPIGTRIRSNMGGFDREHTICGELKWYDGNLSDCISYDNAPWIYYKGEWAEILELPKLIYGINIGTIGEEKDPYLGVSFYASVDKHLFNANKRDIFTISRKDGNNYTISWKDAKIGTRDRDTIYSDKDVDSYFRKGNWIKVDNDSKAMNTDIPEKWCVKNIDCFLKQVGFGNLKNRRPKLDGNFNNFFYYIDDKGDIDLSHKIPIGYTEITKEQYIKAFITEKEEWKVGDWVFALRANRDDHRLNKHVPIFQIAQVRGSYLRSIKNDGSGIHEALCRKATQQEIYSFLYPEKVESKVKPPDLKSTKIWIGNDPDLMRRVQERLFELGYRWGDGGISVKYTDYNYLTIYNDNSFKVGTDKRYFDDNSGREICFTDLVIATYTTKEGYVMGVDPYQSKNTSDLLKQIVSTNEEDADIRVRVKVRPIKRLNISPVLLED